MTPSRKRIAIAILAGLVSLVAASIVWWPFGSSSTIEKARAFARMSEFDRARSYYQDYLLGNPQDIGVRLEYAGVLGKAGEMKKQGSILDDLDAETADLAVTSEEVRNAVREALLGYYGGLATSWEQDGLRLIRESKYQDARTALEAARACYVKWAGYAQERAIASAMRGNNTAQILHSPSLAELTRPCEVALAEACWLQGDKDGALKAVSGDSMALESHASTVNSLGHEEFSHMNYDKARRCFEHALTCYLVNNRKSSDALLAEIKYNIAATYWNQKSFGIARETFKQLQEEAPNYEADKVRSFLQKSSVLE